MMVALFVAAFVGFAIAVHLGTVERAAQLEAEHVAELIADSVIKNKQIRPDLQDYVIHLHSLRARDVVIVDAFKKGLADVVTDEIGKTFNHDVGNEVGKTIKDGQARAFIEKSDAYPDGAYLVVVPLRRTTGNYSETPIGGVVLEYTTIRQTLFAQVSKAFYLITIGGLAIVALVAVFGLNIAKRIAQPLRDLKAGAERIAAQDYDARVAVASRDEIRPAGIGIQQNGRGSQHKPCGTGRTQARA